MSDNRRFGNAEDVAKWIEANVPDWKQQGHDSPMEAALWWMAAQQYVAYQDMTGREWIETIKNGLAPVTPRDIDDDIAARYEDLQEDETVADKDAQIDAEIEDQLRDFWFALRGERGVKLDEK